MPSMIPSDSVPTESKRDTNEAVARGSDSREQLYARHFNLPTRQPANPDGFFEQVSGYGVQLFSQASLYRTK